RCQPMGLCHTCLLGTPYTVKDQEGAIFVADGLDGLEVAWHSRDTSKGLSEEISPSEGGYHCRARRGLTHRSDNRLGDERADSLRPHLPELGVQLLRQLGHVALDRLSVSHAPVRVAV